MLRIFTTSFLLIVLNTSNVYAGESEAGCQKPQCTCTAGGLCPLHRPGTQKRAKFSFDPNAILTMYGVVTHVERASTEAAPTNVQLTVRVGQQLVKVHLGPEKYVDSRIKFSKNDEVQFTGSNIVVEGQEVVLATLVTNKKTTIRLRQSNGKPLFH